MALFTPKYSYFRPFLFLIQKRDFFENFIILFRNETVFYLFIVILITVYYNFITTPDGSILKVHLYLDTDSPIRSSPYLYKRWSVKTQ